MARNKSPFSGKSEVDAKYIKAVVFTGKKDNKNYLRSVYGKNQKHLNMLNDMISKTPKNKYESYVKVDSKLHSEPGWENHNEHLFHGIIPDKSLIRLPNSISSEISAAGREGDKTPVGVTKGPYITASGKENDPLDSCFAHPRFNSSHREAVYSKLADDVFGLGQFVPKTAVYRHPITQKPWSIQEFVKDVVPDTSDKYKDSLHKIKHWIIELGTYEDINNQTATWFIDAPYQVGGHKYKCSNKNIDYKHLRKYIENREGKVIVCENTNADWMPFKPLIKMTGISKTTTEAIWVKE
jgi:hypothetical protein